MKKYKIYYLPEFFDQLDRIEEFMQNGGASLLTVQRYSSSIKGFCEALSTFPNRGVPRDDLRPGLQITHYLGKTIVAYQVLEGQDDEEGEVWLAGVFYGGEDFEVVLSSSSRGH